MWVRQRCSMASSGQARVSSPVRRLEMARGQRDSYHPLPYAVFEARSREGSKRPVGQRPDLIGRRQHRDIAAVAMLTTSSDSEARRHEEHGSWRIACTSQVESPTLCFGLRVSDFLDGTHSYTRIESDAFIYDYMPAPISTRTVQT